MNGVCVCIVCVVCIPAATVLCVCACVWGAWSDRAMNDDEVSPLTHDLNISASGEISEGKKWRRMQRGGGREGHVDLTN